MGSTAYNIAKDEDKSIGSITMPLMIMMKTTTIASEMAKTMEIVMLYDMVNKKNNYCEGDGTKQTHLLSG